MNDEGLSREEWNQVGADQWRDTLISSWDKHCISLSAAVWWIATGGEARDCDDDELELAAEVLLLRARAKDYQLVIKGRQRASALNEEVPTSHLSDALPFIGADERKFRSGEKLLLSGAPCLQWDTLLEGGQGDHIARLDGSSEWEHLAIARDDMLRLWPEARIVQNATTVRGEAAPIDQGGVPQAPRADCTDAAGHVGAPCGAVEAEANANDVDEPKREGNSFAVADSVEDDRDPGNHDQRPSELAGNAPNKRSRRSKAEAIKAILKRLYPDGRPGISNPDLMDELMKKGHINKFLSLATLAKAANMAWKEEGR